MRRYDVIIIGGGHNGLVAAAYLARAGLSVIVLERLDAPGGAAVSSRSFPGVDAQLSRYSYLVSLLPQRIVDDLDLNLTLRARAIASYTPVVRDGHHDGLLVEREPGPGTADSFRRITGADRDFAAWQEFGSELETLAEAIAPTLLEPLPSRQQIRERIGPRAWERFVAQPLGHTLEATFSDDTVRGVVATDGLIGTFADPHDSSLRQNRCFLYHVIGDGTGEWRVPVGGMGAVSAAMEGAARKAGATIQCGAEVTGVEADDQEAVVTYRTGETEEQLAGRYVLAGVAPAVLDRLRGRTPDDPPEGSQVKLNLVLTRVPRLRSGLDPAVAFAGTFHLDESYENLRRAHAQAQRGELPDQVAGELYCHTLTDPSILHPSHAAAGWHTVTLFGLQLPARLFTADNAGTRAEVTRRYLAALNAYFDEPIEDCLAVDADGQPCVEAKSPLDIEDAVGMPGGHIFHGDLCWPWHAAEEATDDPARRWGVATDVSTVLVCGSGARRGGGVSGIGGHNAAHAVLARTGSA